MVAMPATSVFSYSLTRKYPGHFTWIIVAGAVVLVTLFPFMAFAGNAFQFDPIYTTDPNTTEAYKHWYQKPPFTWTADLDTNCQASILTTGDQLTTTNRGLRYTIDSFIAEDKTTEVSVSAAYRNAILMECEVKSIEIELLRRDESRLPFHGNFWTWGSTYAHSTVECLVDTDSWPLRVNFTNELPSAISYSRTDEPFLALNNSEHPGRYLGSKFLVAWYTKLSIAMSYSVPVSDDLKARDGPSWGSGSIKLTRAASPTLKA